MQRSIDGTSKTRSIGKRLRPEQKNEDVTQPNIPPNLREKLRRPVNSALDFMNAIASAHLAIGRAVCASQDFEVVLLVSFETFRMISEPEYLELTKGAIEPIRFKNPAKNLVKFLSERNNIAPELEVQINELLEDRHTVIHRWSRENGFADADDEEHWRKYEALALKVEAESRRISRLLLSYILKWAEPEWAGANHDEYVNRMKQLFHAAVEIPE